MARRRPFNMLASCFYLLALVIVIEVVSSTVAGFLCYYVNITTVQQVGACLPVTEVISAQWDKILEAILALLVAATANINRPPPPPDGGSGGAHPPEPRQPDLPPPGRRDEP